VTSALASPVRPSSGRIAAIALLGPLVGTVMVFFLPVLLDPPSVDPASALEFLWMLVGFGYLFGLVPAALSATVYFWAAPAFSTSWRRVLGCALIGAACGGLGVLLPIWVFAGDLVIEPPFMLLAAAAGAAALPVTALSFRGRG